MIYCVVPPEFEAELYDKLVGHYEGNDGVTVIVDRRTGPERRRGKQPGPFADRRETRDRRRARIPGTFAASDLPED